MVALLLSCTLVFDDEIDEKVGVADECTSTVAYLDGDGDGFGSTSLEMPTCEVPDGFAAEGGDCDDDDASVNPGVDELCNSVDDDCDGDTDEDDAADAPTWYTDADGDGYGADDSARTACAQPSGTVDRGGDCDDALATINPAAEETDCTDPVDYNCDGSTGYDDADSDGYPACQDCDDRDSANTVPGTWYADADGDGHGDARVSETACVAPDGHVAPGDDCDDSASTTYPGADELCDDIDNDCDTATPDDDALGATWYADTDGDGFGDESVAALACDQPPNFVSDASDCDDTTAAAYPGAPEYCDDLDNDCDSTADEDDALDAPTWYADADGDSYGSADTTWVACDAPAGFVGDGADCDDGDGTVNPGATEVCENGVDEDCSGGPEGCLPSGTLSSVGVGYYGIAGSTGAGAAGQGLAMVPDFDGDGYDDLVVTAGEYASALGVAYLVLGSAAPSSIGLENADAEWTSHASYPLEAAGVGDVNGDGRNDIVIGSYAYDDNNMLSSEGAAHLLLGDGSPSDQSVNDAEYVFVGAGGDRAGYDVSRAGDFNADGLADVLVCAAMANYYVGTAYLLLGSTAYASESLPTEALAYTGTDSGDFACNSGAGGGDVDGDGFDDFVVGAYGQGDGGENAGAAYVVLGSSGPASASLGSADAIFTGEAAGDLAGATGVDCAGDLDGDGYDDVAVGARGNDAGGSAAGAVYVIRGSTSLWSGSLATADLIYTGAGADEWAGFAVALIRDLDADGFDDLAIGSPGPSAGAGSVAVFRGGAALASAVTTDADTTLTGTNAGDLVGYTLSANGDIDADGYADLLIGAQGDDTAGSGTGAAYLILGTGY